MFSIFIVQIMIYPHISEETSRENTKISVRPVKTNHTSTGLVMDGHRSYFPGGFSTSSFWGKCLGVVLKAPQNSRKNNTNILTSPLKKKQRHLQNTTNRCWNQNLKCWNGPSKKNAKKTPSRRFETCVLFRFFFLWEGGGDASVYTHHDYRGQALACFQWGSVRSDLIYVWKIYGNQLNRLKTELQINQISIPNKNIMSSKKLSQNTLTFTNEFWEDFGIPNLNR